MKLFLTACAALCLASLQASAQTSISSLPPANTPSGTEAMPAVQDGQTRKVTPAQIIQYGNTAPGTLTNKTLTAPVVNSPTGITKGDVGLGNVDNTSDATKDAATATLANKTLTAPVINSPTGLTKADVGLSNVDDTSDAAKNTAIATLTNKTLTAPVINGPTGLVKADVGLGNVDNTSDATKNAAYNIATVTLTNKTLTSPVINTPTGIVKGDVGLGNVDNTSDSTKNAASVALTNKTISGASNTITNVSLATGVTGTLPVANGGSGAATLTGHLKGNGTGAFTASSTIPAADVVAPGSTTQVLYNNAGALAGASGTAITSSATSPVLALTGTTDNTIRTANAATAAPLNILAGTSSAGDGAALTLSAGNGSAGSFGGNTTLTGGNTVGDGFGGNIDARGGDLNGTGGTGNGFAGSVSFTGGSVTSGTGTAGDVNFTAGVDFAGPNDGLVSFTTRSLQILLLPTGDLQIGGSSGSTGQAIISNGAGAAPTWQYPGGTTYFNSTTTGNGAGANTDVYSHSVAANTLSVDGQTLEFTAAGTFAATASTDKRVRAVFGATTIYDSGTLAITTANNWQLSCKIMRTGAAAQKSICDMNTSSSALTVGVNYTAPAATLSGAVTLKLTLSGTNASDTVAHFLKEVCVR